MPDEHPHHLEALTLPKLKAVAAHHGLDVSSCKHKKDFVEVLWKNGVTEAQVGQVLETGAEQAPGASEDQRRLEDVKADVQAIAGRPSRAKVLPAEMDEEVERNIDRALLVRPSLFEIDSQVELAWNHMIMADYNDALRMNSETRSKMLDRFSSFQVYSTALSIRAAESIFANLEEAKRGVDPSIRTALAEAKKAFISGSPKHREETLEELERLTLKSYEAFFEGSAKSEEELKTMLLDYESFGTHTLESRRLLEIAQQARQSFNVGEYAKILDEARGAALRARDNRANDIRDSFAMVRSAVQEAHEVGAVLSVGEKELDEAKKALDRKAFKKAVDLLAAIERAADQAHLERIKDKSVMERQFGRVSETIASLERTMQEAASYGMDVQEGLLFVAKAKTALVKRDVVNAAKLTRRLKDQSEPVRNKLYKKRVELGVAKKVEGVKCGKCGEEELYAHPDGARKCEGCGHHFTLAPEPRKATRDPVEPPVSASASGEGKSDRRAEGRKEV